MRRDQIKQMLFRRQHRFACAALTFFLLSHSVVRAQDNPVDTVSFQYLVVDDQQTPISGAQLTTSLLHKQRGRHSWNAAPRRGMTDSKGVYSFSIEKRKHVTAVAVFAHLKGYTTRSKLIRFDAGNRSATIQLSPSVERQVRVVDENGSPIADATLQSISGDRAELGISPENWQRLELPVPKSNIDGILTLPGLTETQPFCLEITHPDFAKCLFRGADPGNPLPSVTMEKGHIVQCRVTCLSDPTAVSQTQIVASISTEVGHYDESTSVDATGYATLRLPDKHATIRAYHPTLACEDWHRNRSRKCDFWLYRYGKLKGRVVNEQNDDGAEGVGVSIATGNKVIVRATTDADGDYTVDVPANAAGLKVQLHDWSQTWIPTDKSVSIRPKAGETIKVRDLTVRPKEPVRGRVLLASGEPVKNAIIIRGFRDFVTLTDENGGFEFVTRDNRSTVIQAYHPHEPLSQSIGAGADSQQVQMVLEQDGTLFGIVTNTENKTLAGIPVVAQGRYQDGIMSIASATAKTLSRDDGTYRIVGLCEGMTYQSQVLGAYRADSRSIRKIAGNEKFIGDRADRRPLVVEPSLLREITQKLAKKPKHPQELIPFDCTDWTNSAPIRIDDLGGKAVLLCFGVSPVPLNVCEVAHQLYGNQGLVVIYLGRGLAELGHSSSAYESILNTAKITFPTAHDEQGRTAKKYGVGGVNDFFCLLYDKHGKFRTEVRWNEIREVRNHMQYEHSRK